MDQKQKLNTGQTIRVGFAFLAILAFWQMYNNVIPLILTKTFHMDKGFSGVIMAADNVLALFLLPLFGGLSDRCKAKIGKRKPFILGGSIAAVFLMLLVPFLDNVYFKNPKTGIEIVFVCVLGCILVAMGTYRSPAVALMPDVTPKPLRSKANAIINLMGALGGIIYLIIAKIMYPSAKTQHAAHVDYLPLFLVVAGIMILSLIVVMFFVNEVQWNAEMLAYEKAHPEENLAEETADHKEVLPKDVKKSLLFLLFSVALWYMGYNAMETWFTTYADAMWNIGIGDASLGLTVATGGAILFFIPSVILASRIGRKKTIMGGILLLSACFFGVFAYTCVYHEFHSLLYILFFLVGTAWAFINVNSLPMVLEMCKGSEVGRFTGFYYSFSMAAQIVTPVCAGALLEHAGCMTLFPYCAVFALLSFVTMLFVRHGDTKFEARRGLEAFEDMD
ncbi:MAG: MFS transporter [Oscillospiraceae bacterium]|nr:MFS transporter [Oscillospiraceae bacterium]